MACFPSNFTEAIFHCTGTTDCPAGVVEIMQGYQQSRAPLEHHIGDAIKRAGADLDLDFLTAVAISSTVISSQFSSAVGGGEDGRVAKAFGSV